MRLAVLFLLVFPFIGFGEDDDRVNILPTSNENEISIHIGEQNHAAMVQIITESGIVLWTEHRKEPEFKLSMAYFPPGTYTIQISVYDKVELHTFVKR